MVQRSRERDDDANDGRDELEPDGADGGIGEGLEDLGTSEDVETDTGYQYVTNLARGS